jgi:hypothetical protein
MRSPTNGARCGPGPLMALVNESFPSEEVGGCVGPLVAGGDPPATTAAAAAATSCMALVGLEERGLDGVRVLLCAEANCFEGA